MRERQRLASMPGLVAPCPVYRTPFKAKGEAAHFQPPSDCQRTDCVALRVGYAYVFSFITNFVLALLFLVWYIVYKGGEKCVKTVQRYTI